MYLSRIEVNPRRRETVRALTSPQILHAALEAGFPSGTKDEHAGVRNLLWRTDRLKGSLYILVQSVRRPDFTHVIEQFGWPASGQTWETREYGAFLEKLEQGQKWRFRLSANPVHSVNGAKENGKRGEVKAHVTVEQQRKWLLDKSAALGFSVEKEEMDVVHRETVRFRRTPQAKSWVVLSRATFEGVLTIADAAVLTEAMKNGIGRAKAYGCGLLTLSGI